MLFLVRQLAVPCIQCVILLVVHGIIGFFSSAPGSRVLPGDHSLVGNSRSITAVSALASIFKMLMFNDSRIRHLIFCIVDHRISLVVLHIQDLRLKPEAPVFQFSKAVIIVSVDHAGKYDVFRLFRKDFPVRKEICHKPHLSFFQHALDDLRITADRDSLILVIKVIIIIDIAHRKSPDNKAWKLCGASSPLLFCITLDQLFINIFSYQGNRLLLQILGFRNTGLLNLSLNDLLCFCRSPDAPHLTERIHIERQVIKFIFIPGYRAVGIAVKFGKLLDIIPDLLV